MVTVDGADTLSRLVQMRTATDVHVGKGWLFFAVASYVLWTSLGVLFLSGLLRRIPSLSIPVFVGSIHFDATSWLSLGGFAASTGLAYLVFRVIDRQNKHGLRTQGIFWETLNRVRSDTRPGQISVLLPLSSAEQDFSELVQKTHERSAVLWAMLVLIPYLGWIFLVIALYHLSQSSDLHERAERLLIEDLERIIDTRGSTRISVYYRYPSAPNSVGFLLASLVTFGLFSLFWLNEVISGPEAHFGYHSAFEPNLLVALAGFQKVQ